MKEDRTITQICKQCSELYVPTRRGAQKFCSASCRSRYWFLKKQGKSKSGKDLLKQVVDTKEQKPQEIKDDKPISVEKMSLPGVGNSFWGALAAEAVAGVVKNAGKRDSDKPATKGDIDQLYETFNKRYLPIVNYQDPFNRRAFYDKETCSIVIYNEQLNLMELPI